MHILQYYNFQKMHGCQIFGLDINMLMHVCAQRDNIFLQELLNFHQVELNLK